MKHIISSVIIIFGYSQNLPHWSNTLVFTLSSAKYYGSEFFFFWVQLPVSWCLFWTGNWTAGASPVNEYKRYQKSSLAVFSSVVGTCTVHPGFYSLSKSGSCTAITVSINRASLQIVFKVIQESKFILQRNWNTVLILYTIIEIIYKFSLGQVKCTLCVLSGWLLMHGNMNYS